MVTAVVGANWGDEGKGKITDMLADEADIVIRFQGGANAGHTIVNNYGKFALHTLPSGVFHSHITNIIGHPEGNRRAQVDHRPQRTGTEADDLGQSTDGNAVSCPVRPVRGGASRQEFFRFHKVRNCTVLFGQVCKDRFPGQRAV